MLSILNLTKTNKLILATFAFLAVLAFGSGRAHAATLTVSGGCTLNEAITSINTTTSEPGCSPIGSYGTSDTINIPAGTITLTANITPILLPITIQGAGIDQTIIDGDSGQYRMFDANTTGGQMTISDMKLTAFFDNAVSIQTTTGAGMLSNLDVDGQDADGGGVFLKSDGAGISTFSSNNVYVHDLSKNGDSLGFSISRDGAGTTNAVITNTTVANVTSTGGGGGAYGFGMYSGVSGGSSGGGTLNVNVTNVTIDNLSGADFVAPFYALAFGTNLNSSVTANVSFATITGTRGSSQVIGSQTLDSAAFYAISGGFNSGFTGTSTINVKNSLFADNLTDGESRNCGLLDATAALSGTGTGVSVINSLGHNISDDASCSGFTQTGDQQNLQNIISNLGPLQDNGGVVPTRALLAGSPAISSGSSVLGVTTDARGIARPNTCPSVGAFQFEGAVCAATTTNANAGGAAAPNTGIGAVSPVITIIATSLGLGIIAYALRKRTAVK